MKNLVLVLFFSYITYTCFSQASTEQFGQNRIQYRTFDWKYFDSTHFRVFFYDYGKGLAQYVLNNAEKDLPNIIYMMGGRLTKKLNLVVYNSFADYKQTNIGSKNEQINNANGGKVDMALINIPIYFNGDHEDLKKQVRYGISNVIKDNMLFGENVKEAFKNAIKMNLPEWYTSGYVTYISEPWTAQRQNDILNITSSYKKFNFNDAAFINPQLVGHSFWNFIEKKYGEGYVSNLLYLTRYRKSVNDAIIAVTGKTIKEIFTEWYEYYNITIEEGTDPKNQLPKRVHIASLKAKTDIQYSDFKLSPNGKELAFIQRKDGQHYVYMLDTKYDKKYLIMDGGIRALSEVQDPNYPLIAWSNTGAKIAIFFERDNVVRVKIFDSKSHKIKTKVISGSKIQRITGMCFGADDNTIILTGIKKGQSDVYKMSLLNYKITPLTNDLFDDVQPSYVTSGAHSGIVFMSNRTTPYLGENSKSDDVSKTYHAFFYNEKSTGILTPLSGDTKKVIQAMQYNNEQFCYLQEENNKIIRKIITLEKRIDIFDTFSVTNTYPLNHSVLYQSYNPAQAKLFEAIKYKSSYEFYYTPITDIVMLDEEKKTYIDSFFQNSNKIVIDTEKVVPEYTTEYPTDSSSAFLQEVFTKKQNRSTANIQSDRYKDFTTVPVKLKSKEYTAAFYPDFLQTTLDNSILFTRYQPVAFGGGSYQTPSISGFLTLGLHDIMEDYSILGGARLSYNFKGIDYFVHYTNKKQKNDWSVLYYRTGKNNQYLLTDSLPRNIVLNAKVSTNYIQGSFIHPLNIITSLRFYSGIRLDKFKTYSVDDFSLRMKDSNQVWSTSRFEYIFDNAVSPIFNIWKGSRVKIFTEYLYKLNKKSSGCFNIGMDARNYLRLYKNTILASRLSYAHSGGSAKILYYIGGVDNAIAPQVENNITISDTQKYAFQTIATNLRGFKQGSFIGNSYMVVNEEIRLPIFNTFFKRPIKSVFVRSLQLIAFADVGSAWNGVLPNEENRNIPIILRNGNFTASVDRIQEMALGYGLGFRAKMLGYFFRTDCAWHYGYKKPMWHLSMATDF